MTTMTAPSPIESAADFLARLFLEAKHCYAPEIEGADCLPLVLKRDAAIRADCLCDLLRAQSLLQRAYGAAVATSCETLAWDICAFLDRNADDDNE